MTATVATAATAAQKPDTRPTESKATPNEPTPNPAFDLAKYLAEKRATRIPMSVPHLRLQVVDIEGWHPHWFLDKNLERALAAGYEFVSRREVHLNSRNVATDRAKDGNQDLGTRVRVATIDDDVESQTLTLMKIRIELWDDDKKERDRVNAEKMGAIFRGEKILDPGSDPLAGDDAALRYVKTDSNKPLFQRKRASKIVVGR